MCERPGDLIQLALAEGGSISPRMSPRCPPIGVCRGELPACDMGMCRGDLCAIGPWRGEG